MLRICPTSSDELDPTSQVPFLDVDIRKKQLTVYEPTTSTIGPTEERHLGVTAPKMFAFDAIFSAEDSQVTTLSDRFLVA